MNRRTWLIAASMSPAPVVPRTSSQDLKHRAAAWGRFAFFPPGYAGAGRELAGRRDKREPLRRPECLAGGACRNAILQEVRLKAPERRFHRSPLPGTTHQ